ncbi:Uncharacterised protein [Mycobacteroides abscessus subsp. abscessus]|nr:Uncharacterised protein [Mycobacteroides abscessus subsp. abscessus]
MVRLRSQMSGSMASHHCRSVVSPRLRRVIAHQPEAPSTVHVIVTTLGSYSDHNGGLTSMLSRVRLRRRAFGR